MTEHAGNRPSVDIYTDGGCRPNPGPGAWSAILRYGDHEQILRGRSDYRSTNNRMELTAVTEALKALTRACEVTIYTDSQYVHQGITEWIHKWQQNGWRGSNRRPVKNRDLWQALLEVTMLHKIRWIWVAGHYGNTYNEHAHQIVNEELSNFV